MAETSIVRSRLLSMQRLPLHLLFTCCQLTMRHLTHVFYKQGMRGVQVEPALHIMDVRSEGLLTARCRCP